MTIDPRHPKMMPGQAPYTPGELDILYGMVRVAAAGDPGEGIEERDAFLDLDDTHNHHDDRDAPADPNDCPGCARGVERAGGDRSPWPTRRAVDVARELDESLSHLAAMRPNR